MLLNSDNFNFTSSYERYSLINKLLVLKFNNFFKSLGIDVSKITYTLSPCSIIYKMDRRDDHGYNLNSIPFSVETKSIDDFKETLNYCNTSLIVYINSYNERFDNIRYYNVDNLIPIEYLRSFKLKKLKN